MQISPTNAVASPGYLNVPCEVREGTTLRFALVKIPLDWLTKPQVLNMLDRQVRRDLVSAVSDLEVPLPLWSNDIG